MSRHLSKLVVCAALIGICINVVFGQHLADPNFKPDVANPAYTKNPPRVMFDEAHNNFHTSTGRYKPFTDLLMNDGYRFVINRQPFTKKGLDSFKLLIIANALGNDIDEDDADKPAFSDEESVVVRDWVKGGGALLLVTDPGPFAKSASVLAKQFGIEMNPGIAEDPKNCAEEYRSSMILYSLENHQLQAHPITSGRDTNEKVNRVVVFTGHSLKGPQDSVAFLKLSDSARDMKPAEGGATSEQVSERGVAQALALKYGSGRVVVIAEADMLTALIGDPPEKEPIGMNYPGIDNRQLTLNVMHWLSGLLK